MLNARQQRRAQSVQDREEIYMGLFEEVAGAVVAVEAAKKLDPNAGIFTEGAAAVAGYEGTEAIVDHFEKKDDDGSSQS
jgi:hypothetical protein